MQRHGAKIVSLLRTKWPRCDLAFDSVPAPSV